jgi:hypothetical protein
VGAGVLTNLTGRSSATSAGATDAAGESVYLVFGADTSSVELESWLENNKSDLAASSQESSSKVIQYQDVDQLNVNQQDNAVAIAIDGGDAEAIQRAYQDNKNLQAGSAQSVNATGETTEQTFENVGNVYVVFAEESGNREFSGWVVSDDVHESEQSATATIDQEQEVDQVNYPSQSTAMSIAQNGSYSRAYQRSYQENENVQSAEAVAANVGDGDEQDADSAVDQYQEVDQVNYNEQGIAVAIAVGSGSVAKAWQITCQYNRNKQVADATAINFDPQSVQEVTASAKVDGELSDADVTHSEGGENQANVQAASANVDQFQDVQQKNVSMQNAAVAVALDKSQAMATQASYQGNFNAQVASASAVNVEEGQYEASKVMEGNDAKGDDTWAVTYDNGSKQANEQIAAADIKQTQYIEQLNVNEQYSAVALATNDGKASAAQVNYQVNENVQAAEADAGSGSGSDGNGNDDGDSCEEENNSSGDHHETLAGGAYLSL